MREIATLLFFSLSYICYCPQVTFLFFPRMGQGTAGEEKCYFPSPIAGYITVAPLTKGKVIKRKNMHTSLMLVSHDTAAFLRKARPKPMATFVYSLANFHEKWTVLEKY